MAKPFPRTLEPLAPGTLMVLPPLKMTHCYSIPIGYFLEGRRIFGLMDRDYLERGI